MCLTYFNDKSINSFYNINNYGTLNELIIKNKLILFIITSFLFEL